MASRSGVSPRFSKAVTFPMSATLAFLAAGCSLEMDIEAERVEDWRMFLLWREIGMKSRVSDPFE